MISGIIIFVLFFVIGILGIRALDNEWKNSQCSIGRNHACVVFYAGCGGDVHFDEMNDKELLSLLKCEYDIYRYMPFPCINADDSSHLAEFRIFTNARHNVETIGYITKDKVVFEGREYYFGNDEETIESFNEIDYSVWDY